MDDARFDRLTAIVAAGPSRRRLLGALLGTALTGLLGWTDPTVARRRRRRSRKKKQCPFGRARCGNACCTLGESCRGNRCVHACTDGVLNNGESDTDCGRVCAGIEGAGRCELLKRCNDSQDCRSNFCVERPSGAGAVCAECFLDSDCASQRPRCLDNLCFECSLNSDCAGLAPPHPFCISVPVQAGLNPAPCPSNEPCLCAECRNDGDCPAERPDCQTDPSIGLIGRCLECLEDTDCPPQRPHCETDPSSAFIGRGCVECLDDEHCPQGHLCDEQGRCEELCPGRTRRGRVQAEGESCPDPCSNGVQDGDETDVDCGGGTCPRCADGKRCRIGPDCESTGCDETGRCEAAAECSEDEDCPDGKECVLGRCETPFRCESDDDCSEFEFVPTCCGGDCVGLHNDPRHCGACGNACPGECACCFSFVCAGRENPLTGQCECP